MSASHFPSLVGMIDAASDLTFWQNFNYQIVGVAIVLFSLGFLAVAVFFVGKIVHASVQASHKAMLVPAAPVAPADSAEVGASGTEEISRELRAVISAAVYVSLKGSYRILEINPATSVQTQAWSMEGRRQIFQSHRVR